VGASLAYLSDHEDKKFVVALCRPCSVEAAKATGDDATEWMREHLDKFRPLSFRPDSLVVMTDLKEAELRKYLAQYFTEPGQVEYCGNTFRVLPWPGMLAFEYRERLVVWYANNDILGLVRGASGYDGPFFLGNATWNDEVELRGILSSPLGHVKEWVQELIVLRLLRSAKEQDMQEAKEKVDILSALSDLLSAAKGSDSCPVGKEDAR